jgi:hypothetical protein
LLKQGVRLRGLVVKGFLNIFVLVTLPVFAFVSLRIWKPAFPPKIGRSVPDRFAWTFFALGICLMFNMFLHAAASEDGAYRSWETIRLHRRVFLGFGVIAVTGPLIVFLLQTTRPRPIEPPCKKPRGEDLD